MTARLWIRTSGGELEETTLDSAKIEGSAEGVVLGRDPGADVVIDDEAVSRFHARLLREDGAWKIIDLGSSNKTFVNGDPVREQTLQPGDLMEIGDSQIQLLDEVARASETESRTQVLERITSTEAGIDGRASSVLAALHRLSQALAAQRQENALLEATARVLVEEMGADRGAILLREQDALLCRSAHSRGAQPLRGFVLSQTIYHEVMQRREAILSRDTTADSRFREKASIVGEEIRSVIAAPIRCADQIRGILYLDRLEGEEPHFEREDLYGAAVAAELLGAALQAVSALEGLREERENLVRTLIDSHPIIGTSEGVQRVRDFIRRAAPTESTVLIQGETGSGKELVAQAIHYQSPRAGHPFVTINCAAIPETLLESELFGHEKGAFTGAHARKAGKFEVADKGTVFLDEIGELPLPCQAKLLRLLEERCFERVGGTEPVHVDVRIVAATNRDLQSEAEERRFREDLFYRLNVLRIVVPPLRDRRDDVDLLLDHFLDHFSEKIGGGRKKLSAGARKLLLQHRWPGNVRQLKNAVESGVVMSGSEVIEVEDLPFAPGEEVSTSRGEWAPCSLQEVEREHIQRVLDSTSWNKSKAAEILGIERSTLYSRIRNYQIVPPAERS